MDESFYDEEKLFRAVYPPSYRAMFWKRDGSVSSAAFADPNGLSVNRAGDRNDADAITDMRKAFHGNIVSVLVRNCKETNAVVKYLPSKNNVYHSEIHRNDQTALLSKSQRYYLATHAVIEYISPDA